MAVVGSLTSSDIDRAVILQRPDVLKVCAQADLPKGAQVRVATISREKITHGVHVAVLA